MLYLLLSASFALAEDVYDPTSEATRLALDVATPVEGKTFWVVTVPGTGVLTVTGESLLGDVVIASMHGLAASSSEKGAWATVTAMPVSAGTWRVQLDEGVGTMTAHFTPLPPPVEDGFGFGNAPTEPDPTLQAATTLTLGKSVDLKPDANGKTATWLRIAVPKAGLVEVRTTCSAGDANTQLQVMSDSELRRKKGLIDRWGGGEIAVEEGSIADCDRVARFPALPGTYWVLVSSEVSAEAALKFGFQTRVSSRLFK